MDNYDFKGKVTLVRIDVNVPVSTNGKIREHPRFESHAETIKELIKKKAKIVLISHQGRPGAKDFIDLKQHARLLSKYVGKKIVFVPDIRGEKAIKAIKGLRQGDVIMLDNIRKDPYEMLEKSPEEHAKSPLIQTLAYYGNLFVLDAFSVSHRSHATVVGFYHILPCIAGRAMEKAVTYLDEIKKHAVPPNIFVLGGGKPDDVFALMEYMMPKGEMDAVLSCGVPGELFLMAQGYELGKKTFKKHEEGGWMQYLERAEKLYGRFGDKIRTPVDLAISVRGRRKEISLTELPTNYMIMDIGTRTYKRYAKEINNAGTVVVKGPAGIYENKGFEVGTRELLKAAANTAGHSFIGGGNTIEALKMLKFNIKQFNYVCMGGGALVHYLSGRELPGLRILYAR